MFIYKHRIIYHSHGFVSIHTIPHGSAQAGNAILGGLKDCADSARLQDAGKFALQFGLYAVKVRCVGFYKVGPPKT